MHILHIQNINTIKVYLFINEIYDLTKLKPTLCHHISSDKMIPFANLTVSPAGER